MTISWRKCESQYAFVGGLRKRQFGKWMKVINQSIHFSVVGTLTFSALSIDMVEKDEFDVSEVNNKAHLMRKVRS